MADVLLAYVARVAVRPRVVGRRLSKFRSGSPVAILCCTT
jgi:hypothetical protein